MRCFWCATPLHRTRDGWKGAQVRRICVSANCPVVGDQTYMTKEQWLKTHPILWKDRQKETR